MYNTGPNIKMIDRRRAYARDIRNIYRVLLARKDILAQRAGSSGEMVSGAGVQTDSPSKLTQ
ncbi:hypothetical protein D3C76_1445170 [compost metagenome]